MSENKANTPEHLRLKEDDTGERKWKRWGPYLSERQWGTVREDYSPNGNCWNYFTHDMSRKRAYRWGEDGLMGISDNMARLCFSLCLWNGKDPILKERLFGLTGPEGNHGEDVKEEYYYVDSTPTHSYMKALYKYPQNEFPYSQLIKENAKRSHHEPEFELIDTGIFDKNEYYDVEIEYAKAKPNDVLININIKNHSDNETDLVLLPTLLFRNTWSWGQTREEGSKPIIMNDKRNRIETRQATLGRFFLEANPQEGQSRVSVIYTENESNHFYNSDDNINNASDEEKKILEDNFVPIKNLNSEAFNKEDEDSPDRDYTKDAFHQYIIDDDHFAVNPNRHGTKAAYVYRLKFKPGETKTVQLRLYSENDAPIKTFGNDFDTIFQNRRMEADVFYGSIIPQTFNQDKRNIMRQAYAGLCWNKQFYYYVVRDWLKGDPSQPTPPATRQNGRNANWDHIYNRDIISMPDKWEYPWYAAWDLAFHMIPFCSIDQKFAEEQLLLFLREWYMHPNGQIPAYEFALGDVNPPVHAWACWRVYKNSGPLHKRNRNFLAESFQKLLINFTWWVNRKDAEGQNLFSGGFLGLDNITLFDRSNLPEGFEMEQADGTAWMAFYASTMLRMALELAYEDKAYSAMATKFFEHFLAINAAANKRGGLWDEEDGFYYDNLYFEEERIPLKVRSMVGVIPLFASTIIREEVIMAVPGFEKRMSWVMEQYRDLSKEISYLEARGDAENHIYLLAMPNRKRLRRVLEYVLDENEFLSPYGVRSLSKYHLENPVSFEHKGQKHTVSYTPGESESGLFGGNSNWRGPIWFPLNHLLIESLLRYHDFYGESFKIECPTGSGILMNLKDVAMKISNRLSRLFQNDEEEKRAVNAEKDIYNQENWKDLIRFYEYFHGDNGKGLGASHQTGWTSLIIKAMQYPYEQDA